MRVLDSHLHLWDPARLTYGWLEGPLLARFAADEVTAARRTEGEYAAVFVQADCAPEQFLDEVEWVASIAESTGVCGIVAGVRLDRREQTERDLDAARRQPLVVGVRHLLQGEPDGFAGSARFRTGAEMLAERELTFDACVRGVAQLRDVAALAADLPQLPIVLDHLGKPEIGTARTPALPSVEWSDALRSLAAHERVFCKLSGLPAEAGGDWSAAQVEPFLDVALEIFGSERLMVGSDWPVSAVAASGTVIDQAAMGAWTGAVASWAASRDLDLDAILWRNAEAFYGITPG